MMAIHACKHMTHQQTSLSTLGILGTVHGRHIMPHDGVRALTLLTGCSMATGPGHMWHDTVTEFVPT